jgi:NADH dehydrogenase FAD-containing subunit
MRTHRILILGGGFGGVYAARRLGRNFFRYGDEHTDAGCQVRITGYQPAPRLYKLLRTDQLSKKAVNRC